jgi:hypothetical protein
MMHVDPAALRSDLLLYLVAAPMPRPAFPLAAQGQKRSASSMGAHRLMQDAVDDGCRRVAVEEDLLLRRCAAR